MHHTYTRPTNTKKIFKTIMTMFDYLKVPYRLKLAKIDSSNVHEGMYVFYGFNKDKRQMVLVIEENIYHPEEYEPSIKKRMYDFLELCGYEDTVENRFIMTLLHEIGHIDWVNMLNQFDIMGEFTHVITNVETFLPTVFRKGDIDDMREEGVDPLYIFRVDETYADAFAMKYFIAAKRLLDSEGIQVEGMKEI